ncbi:magnesium/cobalt transporter CorA [soil metagenome]
MLSGCATYRAGVALPDTDTPVAALAALGHGRLTWISLTDPSEEECHRIAGALHLDPRLSGVLREENPRAELRTVADALVLQAGVARYDPARDLVVIGSLTAIISPGLLVTVTRHAPSQINDVRSRLEAQGDALATGPGHVLWQVLQAVVDGYSEVLRDLRADVEKLELEAFAGPGAKVSQRIYLLKRETIDFQHASAALLDPLEDLSTGREVIPGDHGLPDWQATHDRLKRLVHRSASVSDLLSGILTAYHADVALRQNEDMRKISAWVAIAAVPTMLAGIYGMNFEHMPELGNRFAYPVVLLIMASVCTGLYTAFRRRGWL